MKFIVLALVFQFVISCLSDYNSEETASCNNNILVVNVYMPNSQTQPSYKQVKKMEKELKNVCYPTKHEYGDTPHIEGERSYDCSCGSLTATIEYSCPSVCVCMGGGQYPISQKVMVQSTGNLNML